MSNYIISYEVDPSRLIMAINNDSTEIIPALKNASGSDILAYNLEMISQVVPGVSVYRGESRNGNIAFFFALKINYGGATLLFYQNRVAFQQFDPEINAEISTFITEGTWQFDIIN